MVFLKPHGEILIRPLKKRSDPEIGSDAVMIMIPDILRYIAGSPKYKNIKSYSLNFFNLYRIEHEKGFIPLAGPFLGAPQAVMGMEKLIAMGARRIWVIGYCGSLNPGLKIGDILIPVDAVSEEGTSAHYPVEGQKAGTDRDLNSLLEKLLQENDLPYMLGTVWTTDAPYRETIEKIKIFMNAGIMGVEMELSAMITVALFRNVKLSGLLLVSDELFELKWHPGFSSPILKKRSRQVGELILEWLSKITL